MRRSGTAILGGLLCLSLFVSCSGGGKAAPAGDGAGGSSPGTGKSEKFPPLPPPSGFTEIKGEGYTLSAPAAFTPDRRTSSRGAPLLRLNTPRGDDTFVAVLGEVNPPSDASVQSSFIEDRVRLVDKASDVSREELKWPGASKAFLVDWTVQKRLSATDSSTVSVRTVQLITQVNDKLILTVLAASPVESFDESQVGTVLRTFRPA